MSVALRSATRADVPYLVELLGTRTSRPSSLPCARSPRRRSPRRSRGPSASPTRSACSSSRSTAKRRGLRRGSASTGAPGSPRSSGLAIDPGLRGTGVGVEAARALQQHLLGDLGFHRIQMEVYGFNERALRHADRAGWIREGVRRKAYWRNDEWVDGVLFGLVAEDLDPS